jgi:alkanesulfonate monooxygenase SsuD/methylene tetrahydromethanopterin reductase-like flavin-dependent oxidoreductase (luciferase family)
MRFIWFNLMPWPYLPENFREEYRSVWVDIPSSLYDPVRGHEVYNEYLDQLEFAETLGFDGLGVNEHHANAYGLMPSPNLMAAALARRTSRAALVVLGSSIALYKPPIRVAEEFAMLDVISGGRLVAGFPVGTSMDTNYAYGRVPATLRERYAEAHDLIRKAWAADDPARPMDRKVVDDQEQLAYRLADQAIQEIEKDRRLEGTLIDHEAQLALIG